MNFGDDENISFRISEARLESINHFWVPSRKSATVAGRAIGGMVYVGVPSTVPDDCFKKECKALIDPSLPVARAGDDINGIDVHFRKRYSDMSPRSRATYLEWLASGRSDCSYNAYYMLLYFYGLECRFFLDNPSMAEKREILEEVKRLDSLYRDGSSSLFQLSGFINGARISIGDIAICEPTFKTELFVLPLAMKLALGVRVARGDLLSADWMLSWLYSQPSWRRVLPPDLIRDEFCALFKLRFDERFPEGLQVKKPGKALKIHYMAGSGEFNVDIMPEFDGKPFPDISGVRKPQGIAQEVADGVMDELRLFLDYLLGNQKGRGSLEALSYLPPEIWPMFASEDLKQLKLWAGNIVEKGGLAPVGEVVARVGGKPPEKLTKRLLTETADSLAWLGFGLAPDPRFALRSPKLGELAMIFDLGEAVVYLEDVSETYRDALLNIATGAFVAHADGEISEHERETLLETVRDMKNLGDHERRRLAADLEWMLAVAPDLAFLRRKLKDAWSVDVAAIRATLISAAHADGVVRVKEVAAIEKIYDVLGLNPALAYSDLHAGEFRDGLVKARSAKPRASGEAIQSENSTEGIELDTRQITHIHSETARASSVLGDVFGDAETEDSEEEEVGQETLFPGLGPVHAAFATEIIKKEHWTEDAFRNLCARFSLLPSGALEDINEWAFENYGDALLDEHDGFEINPDIAGALRKE